MPTPAVTNEHIIATATHHARMYHAAIKAMLEQNAIFDADARVATAHVESMRGALALAGSLARPEEGQWNPPAEWQQIVAAADLDAQAIAVRAELRKVAIDYPCPECGRQVHPQDERCCNCDRQL